MQYVYLLREGQDYYKVGITHNVRSRVSGLQANYPRKIEIVCTKFMDTEAYNVEQELHKFLEEYKTDGANEWFKLTSEQALELSIRINNYPDIDISERVALATIANNVKRNQRLIERKLDYILNSYQKHLKLTKVTEQSAAQTSLQVPAIDLQLVKEMENKRLFEQARQCVKEEGKASTSLLQRRLRIGYGRAARVIEELEEQGIIGSADGSRARQVLG